MRIRGMDGGRGTDSRGGEGSGLSVGIGGQVVHGPSMMEDFQCPCHSQIQPHHWSDDRKSYY